MKLRVTHIKEDSRNRTVEFRERKVGGSSQVENTYCISYSKETSQISNWNLVLTEFDQHF